MAGALDQVLQEQVVGALLGLAQPHLRAVELQPHLLADIVVQAGRWPARGPVAGFVAIGGSSGAGYVWRRILAAAAGTLRQPARTARLPRTRLAVQQVEPRRDHDQRRPTMVQRCGTSPNTRKPSAIVQTICGIDERRQRRGRRQPMGPDQQIMPDRRRTAPISTISTTTSDAVRRRPDERHDRVMTRSRRPGWYRTAWSRCCRCATGRASRST